MKKLALISLWSLIPYFGISQITSVDTACINSSVLFTAPTGGITYTWLTDTININQTPGTFTSAAVTGLSVTAYSTMNYDNGTWYSFITNAGNSNVVRLTYSGSPNGAYTRTTVGSYGPTGKMEGIEVIKDSATGNWHGFVVNDQTMYRLDFGTSLANAPTSTSINLAPKANYMLQISIAKFGNQWIGFVGNAGSTIIRLDFGSSLTNTPTVTTIPNVGSAAAPSNFALHKEGNNWYMLTANLSASTISRYNFGSNLQNNSPTGTLLGNPSSLLATPRTILLLKDCNQLVAYILNESGSIVKWDFGGSILNTPTVSNAMNPGVNGKNAMVPYFTDSDMYVAMVSFSTNQMYRARLLDMPTFDTTKYYNNTLNHSFATAGTKNMTLFVDQGNFMGVGQSYCKPVVVSSHIRVRDTGICAGNSVTLDASSTGGSGYQWSTSAATPSITVNTAGKYWVTISGSSCITSDTINVSITTPPSVSLGSDTNYCNISTTNLQNKIANPPGAVFLWNTASTNSAISINTAGNYWLRVTKDGCSNTDTIVVSFTTVQSTLRSDTTICKNDSIMLQNLTPAPGYAYLWNAGSSSPTLKAGLAGAYWLKATYNGCSDTDTVNIAKTIFTVDLGPDLNFCSGTSVILQNKLANPAGSAFLWNTLSNAASITVPASGNYWLKVTKDNCVEIDTVAVTFTTVSVDLGNDTTICAGDSVLLSDKIGMPGITYLWKSGATTPQFAAVVPGTYWLKGTLNGCTFTDSISVVAKPYPLVNLGSDSTVCEGVVMELKNLQNNPAGYTYTWSTGANTNNINISQAGIYWLRVANAWCSRADTVVIDTKPSPYLYLGNDTSICTDTKMTIRANPQLPGTLFSWSNSSAEDSINVGPGKYALSVLYNGCSATDSIYISAIPYPLMSLGADANLCYGQTIELPQSVTTDGSYYIKWQDGTIGDRYVVSKPGTYYATIVHICGELNDTVNIDYRNCHVYFPDIFSPNGDGLNDIAKLSGDVSGVSDYSMAIYNRWGQRIFFTENVQQGWAGTYKGMTADVGTYQYMIQFTYLGKQEFLKGDVTLIR